MSQSSTPGIKVFITTCTVLFIALLHSKIFDKNGDDCIFLGGGCQPLI